MRNTTSGRYPERSVSVGISTSTNDSQQYIESGKPKHTEEVERGSPSTGDEGDDAPVNVDKVILRIASNRVDYKTVDLSGALNHKRNHFERLAEALKTNFNLTCINLRGNKMGKEAVEQVAEALEKNKA